MTTRSAISRAKKTSRKPKSSNAAAVGRASAGKSAAKSKAGKLPEWNLADLYSGIDAPEVARDLQKMDAECVAFETDYKGKLAEHVAREDGGQWLAEAVKRYEAIDDLAGRLGSYAGLDSCRRQRRSRDLQILRRRFRTADRASVHLLFFALELNRVDDAVIERAMQTPELGHYRPVDRGSAQGQAVSARGSRRATVSRKIPERLCRLEPAVRPDHLRPALQGRRQGARDRADAEPAAGPRAGKAQGRGAGAGENLQGQ